MFPTSALKGLDADIASAHDSNDKAKLVNYYTQVADEAELHNEIDACCYFLTQALVYALELGVEEHEELMVRLRAYGRI